MLNLLVFEKPINPGDFLRFYLSDRNTDKPSEMDQTLGIPLIKMKKLLNGTQRISREIAVSLEESIGIPADLLLNAQSIYDSWNGRISVGQARKLFKNKWIAFHIIKNNKNPEGVYLGEEKTKGRILVVGDSDSQIYEGLEQKEVIDLLRNEDDPSIYLTHTSL